MRAATAVSRDRRADLVTNLHLDIDGARQTPFSSDTIDVECASTQNGLGEYVQFKAIAR